MQSVPRSLLLAALALLACASQGAAQAPASAAPPDTLEELQAVIVTGERPGPAMWKITSKGNTLWILPVFGPLPDDLVWRARQVESVIRDSQAVYVGGRWIEAQNDSDEKKIRKALENDKNQTLQDVLPADMYRKFMKLSTRYADGAWRFERYRPIFAVDMLRTIAMARLRLTSDGGVTETVRRLAVRHGVKFLAIDAISKRQRATMISELGRAPRSADVACVRRMLDRMDADLLESIERANAWSRGNVEVLRQGPGIDTDAGYREACKTLFQYTQLARSKEAAARRTLYPEYVRALKKNHSTLALVAVSELFANDGVIARFRKAGYTIETPGLPADAE